MYIVQSTVLHSVWTLAHHAFPQGALMIETLNNRFKARSLYHCEIHVPVASTEGFLAVVSQANRRLILFPLDSVIPAWLEETP